MGFFVGEEEKKKKRAEMEANLRGLGGKLTCRRKWKRKEELRVCILVGILQGGRRGFKRFAQGFV